MLKNICKFKVKEKKPNYNFELFYYAQAAKKERLLKNWTLDYVSHGLCSISYMSKFENHLIKPETRFLKELQKVYGVKFENKQLEKTQEILDKVLTVFIHNDYDALYSMFQSIKHNNFNVPRSLILCFYYLLIKDDNSLIKEIKELDTIKDSMTNQEQILLLFIVMQHKLNNYDFLDMVYYLKCFDEVMLTSYEEKWMLAYIEMLYGYHINDISIILKHKKILFDEGNMFYPTSGKIKANLIFLEIISRNAFANVIKEVEVINANFFNDKFANDIFYLRCLILLNGFKYEEVVKEIIDKELMVEDRFLALIGYCAYKTRLDLAIQYFENYSTNFSYAKSGEIHKIFNGFISMLIKDPKNKNLEIREIMKFDIIPYNKTHKHVLYSKVYYDYFVNILRSESKYKDTVNFIMNY
ncbi:MAG: helix-turn-helix transcriptional regulator [Bacilli bacterium]|jgi:hypothetical protein|nr:helix-turn-helix transcriptional regulator [Bacilli bacterium]